MADLEKELKDVKTENGELKKEVKELKAANAQLRKELDDAKGAAIVVAGDKIELSKEDLKLIDEACKAYKVPSEYVMNSRIDAAGHAVILTKGGAKVRYAKGMEVEPLSQIRITGVNPDAKKRKPIAGKVKK